MRCYTKGSEHHNFTHGGACKGKHTAEYRSWRAMWDRTRRHPKYKDRPICARWKQFENFLADMGERPLSTSLDRIDNTKGYAASNCRWASRKDQARQNAKITDVQAAIIAATNFRRGGCRALARELGVAPSTIYRISKGVRS